MLTFTRKLAAIAVSLSLALPLAAQADPAKGPETVTQTRYGGADSLHCLTEALYFEARGEGRSGQRAVAEVILNRVDSRTFPNSVCGVVHQRGQFTYNKGRRMSNAAAAARARRQWPAALPRPGAKCARADPGAAGHDQGDEGRDGDHQQYLLLIGQAR